MGWTMTRHRRATRVATRNAGAGRRSGTLLSYVSKRGIKAKVKERSRVGTKTRTMTKRKLNEKAVPTTIGSISWAITPHHRCPKAVYMAAKAQALQTYVSNGAGRITSTIGAQNAATILSIMDSFDIHNLQVKTSTQVTEGASFQNLQSLYLQSAYAEILFTNQDYGPCHLQLYDVVCRKDIDNVNYSDPATAWAVTLGHDVGNQTSTTVVGSAPFQSQCFTQNYKVLRITDVTLPTGSVHVHKVAYKCNKYMVGEYINEMYQNNTTTANYKGLTFFTMAVHHGYPLNDSTTKTQVSIGATNLDYVTKWEYCYKPVQFARPQNDYNGNLPTSFTIAGELINIGTSVITGDLNA